ncbi:MAG: hypothetical protein WEF86_15140 [Gemmatimonadota bacterium]
MIGHGLWRERFGGDPAIVGRTLHIDSDVAASVLSAAERTRRRGA